MKAEDLDPGIGQGRNALHEPDALNTARGAVHGLMASLAVWAAAVLVYLVVFADKAPK